MANHTNDGVNDEDEQDLRSLLFHTPIQNWNAIYERIQTHPHEARARYFRNQSPSQLALSARERLRHRRRHRHLHRNGRPPLQQPQQMQQVQEESRERRHGRQGDFQTNEVSLASEKEGNGGGEEYERADVLQALLEADPASIHSRDDEGRTPLHTACGAGRSSAILKLLMDFEDCQHTGDSCKSPGRVMEKSPNNIIESNYPKETTKARIKVEQSSSKKPISAKNVTITTHVPGGALPLHSIAACPTFDEDYGDDHGKSQLHHSHQFLFNNRLDTVTNHNSNIHYDHGSNQAISFQSYKREFNPNHIRPWDETNHSYSNHQEHMQNNITYPSFPPSSPDLAATSPLEITYAQSTIPLQSSLPCPITPNIQSSYNSTKLLIQAYPQALWEKDCEGEIPLHAAASWGTVGSVLALLEGLYDWDLMNDNKDYCKDDCNDHDNEHKFLHSNSITEQDKSKQCFHWQILPAWHPLRKCKGWTSSIAGASPTSSKTTEKAVNEAKLARLARVAKAALAMDNRQKTPLDRVCERISALCVHGKDTTNATSDATSSLTTEPSSRGHCNGSNQLTAGTTITIDSQKTILSRESEVIHVGGTTSTISNSTPSDTTALNGLRNNRHDNEQVAQSLLTETSSTSVNADNYQYARAYRERRAREDPFEGSGRTHLSMRGRINQNINGSVNGSINANTNRSINASANLNALSNRNSLLQSSITSNGRQRIPGCGSSFRSSFYSSITSGFTGVGGIGQGVGAAMTAGISGSLIGGNMSSNALGGIRAHSSSTTLSSTNAINRYTPWDDITVQDGHIDNIPSSMMLRASFISPRLPVDPIRGLEALDKDGDEEFAKLELLARASLGHFKPEHCDKWIYRGGFGNGNDARFDMDKRDTFRCSSGVGVHAHQSENGCRTNGGDRSDNDDAFQLLHVVVSFGCAPEIVWHSATKYPYQVRQQDQYGRSPLLLACERLSHWRRSHVEKSGKNDPMDISSFDGQSIAYMTSGEIQDNLQGKNTENAYSIDQMTPTEEATDKDSNKPNEDTALSSPQSAAARRFVKSILLGDDDPLLWDERGTINFLPPSSFNSLLSSNKATTPQLTQEQSEFSESMTASPKTKGNDQPVTLINMINDDDDQSGPPSLSCMDLASLQEIVAMLLFSPIFGLPKMASVPDRRKRLALHVVLEAGATWVGDETLRYDEMINSGHRGGIHRQKVIPSTMGWEEESLLSSQSSLFNQTPMMSIDRKGSTPGYKSGIVHSLLVAYPRALEARDGKTGLFPFMLAATSKALTQSTAPKTIDDCEVSSGGVGECTRGLETVYRLLLEAPAVISSCLSQLQQK